MSTTTAADPSEQVAEKVMGWEWCEVRLRGETNTVRVLLRPGDQYWRQDGRFERIEFSRVTRPDYLTSAAADYAVLRRVRDTWGKRRIGKFKAALRRIWTQESHHTGPIAYRPGDYSRAALAVVAPPESAVPLTPEVYR